MGPDPGGCGEVYQSGGNRNSRFAAGDGVSKGGLKGEETFYGNNH